MKLQKMSLANIQGKLSRAEMKVIMAGSENSCSCIIGDGLGSCVRPGICQCKAHTNGLIYELNSDDCKS
jgi:chemotaxis receptor (MCP) glutamine deamidase CheD